MIMTIQELYNYIYQEVSRIIESHQVRETFGRDLIDLPPDKLILRGAKFPFNEGTIECTTTTAEAHPTFEWDAEVTIKEPENVEHYLLKPDQTIVETYGKNIYDVEVPRAERLLTLLKSLQ